ncbi:ATPase [Paucibacter sp. KBW04]|uniref:SRPBCC domain-containing protein n=1 Tax=Paucibacter sp. KBW04 TaxID=2153361 RepID=UPI000F56938D|nr:SRPBCC domain-containing protein [Paucibacter sp. KBW04]RQO62582.1 ATPase [Paucibacter sp. KBW04]
MSGTTVKKTLQFSVQIQAAPERVWQMLQDDQAYRDWTSAFCEGSHFEGAWEEGAAIRFLSPKGDGICAEIAQSRPPEFLSIRHLGEVQAGIDVTESAEVRAWAPAYENYHFLKQVDGTELRVVVETLPDFEAYMQRTFPLALGRLKALCEA